MFKEQRHQDKFDDLVRTMACEVVKGSTLLDLVDKTAVGLVIVRVAEGIMSAQIQAEVQYRGEQTEKMSSHPLPPPPRPEFFRQ